MTMAVRLRRRPNEEFRMQSRSKEFHAHAAECRELASRIRDPEVKRQYEELARQWVELAEQAERRCHQPPGDSPRRN
jgi:DNA primase